MLSPRRAAQVGLGAACVLFLTSLAVLASGAAEARRLRPRERAVRIGHLAQPGTVAPDVTLPDTYGDMLALPRLRGQTVVLCFTSIHCPVSTDYDARLAALSAQHARDGRVRFVCVNSNVAVGDAERDEIRHEAKSAGLRFPQLIDHGTGTARAYGVDHSPTFVVIDPAGVVRYRGGFDDNRTAEQARTHPLADAVESVVRGEPVAVPVTRAFGCAIVR